MVDDREENLLALEAVLEPLGHRLVSVTSGTDGAEGAPARRVRLHPARRPDAGARRLRAGVADQAAQALAAHPDHLRHRAVEGGQARLPRLLGRRRRLHLQADRPRRAPLEGGGLRRALGEERSSSRSRPSCSTSARSTQLERASEARYRQLADAMPQIVWTSGPDGGATYFNRRWFEYTGMTPDEVGPNAWHAVVHPDDLPDAVSRREQTLRSGEPFEVEYRFRGRRRHVPLAPRAAPCRCATRPGSIEFWVGTATDIHDRKIIEEQRSVHRRRGRRARALARLPRDARAAWPSSPPARSPTGAPCTSSRPTGPSPRSRSRIATREGHVRARAAGALSARSRRADRRAPR